MTQLIVRTGIADVKITLRGNESPDDRGVIAQKVARKLGYRNGRIQCDASQPYGQQLRLMLGTFLRPNKGNHSGSMEVERQTSIWL